MCGLLGIAGSGIILKDLEVFQDLAVMSQVRGTDATGVLYGHNKRKMSITKDVGNVLLFFEYLSKDDMRNMMTIGNNFLAGHVRKATRGKMNVEGAQPFNFTNIAGMHNGTLYGDFEGYHSDSEKLLHQLNDKPLEEVLPSLYTCDAAALIWYNKKSGTLHFYHDTLRDLYIAVNTNGSVVYWASEIGILRAALERNNISYKAFHLLDNHEYVIDPSDVKTSKGKEDRIKYKEIKDHSSISFVNYKQTDWYKSSIANSNKVWAD